MKKSFLLLIAALLLGSASFAQSFDLCVGPKVGYQTAQLSYNKADIKSGFAEHFTIGAFGRVTFNKLYVQPEVLWFKSGSAFSFDFENVAEGMIPEEEVTITWNPMNIQVPVFVGYKVLDLDIMSLRVQVGPTANFIIGGKPVYDRVFSITPEEGADPITVEEGDPILDTKTIAWGIQGGIGVDVLNKITLDINYNYGISKIFGANLIENTELGQYVDLSNIDNTKQNLFMVTLGFKFL